MGLLDNAVRKEIAKSEQKNREELVKFSSEMHKLKREKELADAVHPFLLQGLKELPGAMQQIGAEPLPLVVEKNPSLFFGESVKCMWGYYLLPRGSECYDLFLTSDGKYHAGIRTFSSDRKVTDKNKIRVSFTQPRVTKPFQKYIVEDYGVHEEEISEDEAVSMIAKDLIDYTARSGTAYHVFRDAVENDDPETAAAELFAIYIEDNVKYNERLLNKRGELEFLRSLNRK